jgi:hypothetical protein
MVEEKRNEENGEKKGNKDEGGDGYVCAWEAGEKGKRIEKEEEEERRWVGRKRGRKEKGKVIRWTHGMHRVVGRT